MKTQLIPHLTDLESRYGYTIECTDVYTRKNRIYAELCYNSMFNKEYDGCDLEDLVYYIEQDIKTMPVCINIPDEVYESLAESVCLGAYYFEHPISGHTFCAEIDHEKFGIDAYTDSDAVTNFDFDVLKEFLQAHRDREYDRAETRIITENHLRAAI